MSKSEFGQKDRNQKQIHQRDQDFSSVSQAAPQFKLNAGKPLPTPPPTGKDSTSSDTIPSFSLGESTMNSFDSLFMVPPDTMEMDTFPAFSPEEGDSLTTETFNQDTLPATHPTAMDTLSADSLNQIQGAEGQMEESSSSKKKEFKFLTASTGKGYKNEARNVFAIIYRLEQIGFLNPAEYAEIAKDKAEWEKNGKGHFPDRALSQIISRYQTAIEAPDIDGYITPNFTTEKALLDGRFGPVKKEDAKSTPHSEESEITCIAKEIFQAGKGMGTDEERIYQHLEMLDQNPAKVKELKNEFQNLYGVELIGYLKDELWDWGFWKEETKAFELLGMNGESETKATKLNESSKMEESPAKLPIPSGDQKVKDLAIAKAWEYVNENPGKSYGYNPKKPNPQPGEGKIDCSNMLRNCLWAATGYDPYLNENTGRSHPGFPAPKGKGTGEGDRWNNGVAVLTSNPNWVERPYSKIEKGDAVAFRTNRNNHQGPNGEYDHIGIVTEIFQDAEGATTSFKFIHSFGTAPGGPQETLYEIANPKSYLSLTGAYEWNYEMDK